MAVQLKKSMVITELEKGGSVKVIAERLGITIPLLKKAAKTFGLNLRRKPTKEVMEFIDDVEAPEVETESKVTLLM